MQALMDWILNTPVSRLMIDYGWAWPICESLHFIGLVMMAGSVGVFDLRLLGVAKGIPAAALHRLLPYGIAGFMISLTTGLMFISGAPDQYFYNPAFHFKLLCLGLIGLNVVLFYALQFEAVQAMGPGDRAPRSARVMAAASLLLLAATMYCGRMLTFFRPPGFY